MPLWRSGLVVIGLVGAAFSCGGSSLAPATGWHVDGGFLRDPQGRAVILHGANLAGAHKSAPYWGSYGPEDFARLRGAWGMNAIRFLVSWAAIEPEEGHYDEAFLDAVAERMQWAKDADLLVVLDMHQDVYGEGFALGGGDGAPKWSCDASNYAAFEPVTEWYLNDLSAPVTACYDHFWHTPDLVAHYEEAWRRLLTRVADSGVVIGFDPMNEPYWGSTNINAFEPELLQPFYEDLVPKLRAIAPNAIAFLEPSTIRNLGTPTNLVPFPFANVAYSPHSYDRDAESGIGFDPSHRDALIANVDALAGEAKGLNAALFIGEYGGMADTPGIAPYMTAQYDAAGKQAASSMVWSYDANSSYGLLDADGTEKTVLVDLVARPYPERTAGTPSSYAFDATTSTFTFTYVPDARVTAPTLVSIPDRVYANGYSVDCNGCEWVKSPGRLTITEPGNGGSVIVTVRPS